MSHNHELEQRAVITQSIGLAMAGISNYVKGRNKRLLGALAKAYEKNPDRMVDDLLLAKSIASYAQLWMTTYFMRQFRTFHRLRGEFEKKKDYATVRTMDMQVQWFYATYQFYAEAKEIAYEFVDMVFDQFYTIATMLGLDKEYFKQGRTGPIPLSVDRDHLERRRRQMKAGEDRVESKEAEDEKEPAAPTFEDALEFARGDADSVPDVKDDD